MPRLQFSLRALLILMAIVGAAIVVYRWPWTETKVTKGETITTQFRRGWTGKALKYGVQRTTTSSPIVHEDWYEDDELRRKRVFQAGILYNDESFRNRQLDGPYFDFGASSTTRGNYRQGKKHGAWQYTFMQSSEDVVYRNGLRHGPRSWKTPQGRVLQTAEYADDRLTHWNGQPVADVFRRWVAESVPDPKLQRKLLLTIAEPPKLDVTLHHRETVHYAGDPPESFVVQGADSFGKLHVHYRGRPVGEAILEQCLDHSDVLAYRYGVLQVVPISAAELDWQDRTGVYDIHFPPGSAAEQFWLSPAPEHLCRVSVADGLTDLFKPEHDGPVQLDPTNVTDLNQLRQIDTGPTRIKRVPTFPRICRDLVGQYLNRADFRCELRDGKLLLLPQNAPPQPQVGPGMKEPRTK